MNCCVDFVSMQIRANKETTESGMSQLDTRWMVAKLRQIKRCHLTVKHHSYHVPLAKGSAASPFGWDE